MPPATPPPDHRHQAVRQAIARAASGLALVRDWPARCARLGLPQPGGDNALRVPFLGATLIVHSADFTAARDDRGADVPDASLLLALHYLHHEGCVTPTAEWIAFRDFPGGAFYWEPFHGRVVQPLLRHFGNRLDALRHALDRYDSTLATGNPDLLRAWVPALGPLQLHLIYRAGDEEFGPTADVLFDTAFRRVFCAEDAAALAGLFTAGLRPPPSGEGQPEPG